MRQAQKGDTVKVHFKGTLDDGTIFADSKSGDPVQFTIGEGTLIPGFEEETVGMEEGEQKSIRLEAERAFGNKRDELVSTVPREAIPDEIDLSVGTQLQVKSAAGQPIQVVVTDVSEEDVTLDANPPLAGRPLTFDIELVEFV
ncbi:MAG TPA: FKBP-type peptidyl-prolyl cis-trans isomerase [Desulfosarcina sp.]|nr:FKBP-type peptidyl-prolyl cis-trans isomerase [Desulfosarcina sp.]